MRIVNYLKREPPVLSAKKQEENSSDRAARNLKREHPEPRAKKQEENSSDRAARITPWATVAIAILTAVTAVVAIAQWTVLRGQSEAMRGQWDEMISAGKQSGELIKANSSLAEVAKKLANATVETARISQDAFTANQRAWIGPRNARISAEPRLSEPITITLEYQNTGREPATNFTYNVESFTAAREEENKSGLRRTTGFMTRCMGASHVSNGQVIYPSTGSNSYYILMTRLDKKLIDEKVVSGDKAIFFQGCFIYQTLMTVRHSYFCYRYKRGDSKIESMKMCNAGHNAD